MSAPKCPWVTHYRNIIAGSPPGEQISIYFENIRFASQKLKFSIFFSKKKTIKFTLNSLEVKKYCKNQFILLSLFCLQIFLIFTFLFLELFLDELAMVLQYIVYTYTIG